MADFKVTNHQELPAFGSTGELSHRLTLDLEWGHKRSESEETDIEKNNEAQCKMTSDMLELSIDGIGQ